MTVRELAWDDDPQDVRLHRLRFEQRLPFAIESIAACANGIAQRLEMLFAVPLAIRMMPPHVLGEEGSQSLRDGARVYELHGEHADATVLLDEATARRIVALAFGEDPAPHMLSPIESQIVDRCVSEITGGLHPICGALSVAQHPPNMKCRVYCELSVGAPLGATLGIVLWARPAPAGPTLGETTLEDLPIDCWVRLGTANVDIFTVSALEVGDVLRLDTKVGAFSTLNLGLEPIAAGEGGVLGHQTAFRVHELI